MRTTISIAAVTCNKCGRCAEVCPNKILARNDKKEITVRPDRIHVCFRCGQCMAVCPTKSIAVEGLSYDSDFFDLPPAMSYESLFYDMIHTRRAVRNFRDTPVPGELLEKIVDAISFAPMGFPPFKVEIIVVQDTGVIKKSLPHMIELYDSLLKVFRNPFVRFMIRREVGPQRFRVMEHHLIPLLGTRMPELKQGTEDTITRNAPAMILFCGDRKGEEIREDAFVAATYGMLAAHALGLGGSIMSIIPPAIERSAELRKLFRVPDGSEILTSLILGYPKYKYARGIKRRVKSVQWI
jgi:ferredoxin